MKKLIINIIKFYRQYISTILPPHCRYYPSCSEYGIEAIEKYGIIKGAGMTLVRILKCNQLFKGGYDPVK